MKIDHLETITLRFEYEEGFTYAGGKCTARLTSLASSHRTRAAWSVVRPKTASTRAARVSRRVFVASKI